MYSTLQGVESQVRIFLVGVSGSGREPRICDCFTGRVHAGGYIYRDDLKRALATALATAHVCTDH